MYKVFFYPLIIAVIVHLIKMFIDVIKKRFTWSHFWGYGGMPSSHAALVASLATSVYLYEGISVGFGISVVFAVVVIRDALGLRSYLSEHSRVINKLIKDLPDEEEYKYPYLEERIAHTSLQLIVGALLGIIITFLLF